MVNDVEFIINFARAKEAVQRLATTDKVEYFGNLIRNGYLQGKHIDGSIFDEYIHILNTCLLYTSPSPRDTERSRMPSSA